MKLLIIGTNSKILVSESIKIAAAFLIIILLYKTSIELNGKRVVYVEKKTKA